jgi:hypothetical protein
MTRSPPRWSSSSPLRRPTTPTWTPSSTRPGPKWSPIPARVRRHRNARPLARARATYRPRRPGSHQERRAGRRGPRRRGPTPRPAGRTRPQRPGRARRARPAASPGRAGHHMPPRPARDRARPRGQVTHAGLSPGPRRTRLRRVRHHAGGPRLPPGRRRARAGQKARRDTREPGLPVRPRPGRPLRRVQEKPRRRGRENREARRRVRGKPLRRVRETREARRHVPGPHPSVPRPGRPARHPGGRPSPLLQTGQCRTAARRTPNGGSRGAR